MGKEVVVSGKSNEIRTFYLDVARAFAIIAVAFNHAVNRVYENYYFQYIEFANFSRKTEMFKAVVSVFSRLGVPIFLMITGALVLSKDFSTKEKVKRFYTHNCLSLFITTEIWLCIMFWFIYFVNPESALKGQSFGVILFAFVKNQLFLDQVTLGNMWYMAMIIMVYLVIPVFAFFIQKYGIRFLLIPCALSFLANMLIPNINGFLQVFEIDVSGFSLENELTFSLGNYTTIILYLLFIITGYLIAKEKVLAKVNSIVLGLLLILIFGICCIYQYVSYKSVADYLLAYSSCGVLICAGLLFELFRRHADILKKMQKPITYFSKISLGIFFLHLILMEAFCWNYIYDSWNKPLTVLLLGFGSIILSVILIYLLEKIPGFKKYLFRSK